MVYHFWKQVGKASPLGWWTLKPRSKEERELAHLYDRREFPYPGEAEAMEEFIAKGDMTGTRSSPKGIVETDKDSLYYQEMQNKKFEHEAKKLWLRMRNYFGASGERV
ncbi:hypothetical protein CRYUN_Cryun02cG0182100 [Craigia yunnanensis]